MAHEEDYVKPEISDTLALRNSRHPILEKVSSTPVVPNDCYVDDSVRFQIVTGPNMSGKSIYLNQIAIISVMAQLGCYVPCDYASIKISTKLLTRIGHDVGRHAEMSSFTEEMRDAMFILQQCNDSSMVIIDELGRGTSTTDGIALTIAVSEELLKTKSFVLLATHFSEVGDVFHEMYIPNHMSLNTYHYEFLCFYRWIVYAEVVKNWNIANPNDPITRILTMDSDILFMKNVAQLFQSVLNSINFTPNRKKDDFELTVLGLGAIHLWLPKGLQKYSDFIYEWYNDTNVKENIKKALNYNKLMGEYHFSDMQLVEVFIEKDNKTRDSCFLHSSTLNDVNDAHSNYRRCLIDYLQCFPLINYSERGNRIITFNKTSLSLKGSHSNYPYCAMVSIIYFFKYFIFQFIIIFLYSIFKDNIQSLILL